MPDVSRNDHVRYAPIVSMNVAKLSAERCKACRRQFGFAADFCAYCGVAQRGDGVGPGTPFREAPASEFFGRVPASTVPMVSEPQAGVAAKQSATHTGVGTETNSAQQARADSSGPDGQQPFPGNNAEERTVLSAVGRASLAVAAAGGSAVGGWRCCLDVAACAAPLACAAAASGSPGGTRAIPRAVFCRGRADQLDIPGLRSAGAGHLRGADRCRAGAFHHGWVAGNLAGPRDGTLHVPPRDGGPIEVERGHNSQH